MPIPPTHTPAPWTTMSRKSTPSLSAKTSLGDGKLSPGNPAGAKVITSSNSAKILPSIDNNQKASNPGSGSNKALWIPLSLIGVTGSVWSAIYLRNNPGNLSRALTQLKQLNFGSLTSPFTRLFSKPNEPGLAQQLEQLRNEIKVGNEKLEKATKKGPLSYIGGAVLLALAGGAGKLYGERIEHIRSWRGGVEYGREIGEAQGLNNGLTEGQITGFTRGRTEGRQEVLRDREAFRRLFNRFVRESVDYNVQRMNDAANQALDRQGFR